MHRTASMGVVLTIFVLSMVSISACTAGQSPVPFTIEVVGSNTEYSPGNVVYFKITGLNNSSTYMVIYNVETGDIYDLLIQIPFTEELQRVVSWTVPQAPPGVYIVKYRNDAGHPEAYVYFRIAKQDQIAISLSNLGTIIILNFAKIDSLYEEILNWTGLFIAFIVAALVLRFSTTLLNKMLYTRSKKEKSRYYNRIGNHMNEQFKEVDLNYMKEIKETIKKKEEETERIRNERRMKLKKSIPRRNKNEE